MMKAHTARLCALAAVVTVALFVANASSAAGSYRHRVHRPLMSLRAPSAATQRVARMTRLALLVRREAMLRDFLLAARTETPVLRDDRRVRLDGVEISDTTIGRDFLGAAILRARVHNLRSAPQDIELIADVTSARGPHTTASTILTLHPDETRMVELLAPAATAPRSIRWSAVAF